MRLTLVRHAFAGHKGNWHPDLERPLDALGERQTESLTRVLARRRVRRIISSPAQRCLQTVAPLAEAVDVAVEVWPDLGPEGFSRWILMACIADRDFDRAVLCTHGELMSPLLERKDIVALVQRDGLKRDRLLTKGSAWQLTITAAGVVTDLAHVLPPVEN